MVWVMGSIYILTPDDNHNKTNCHQQDYTPPLLFCCTTQQQQCDSHSLRGQQTYMYLLSVAIVCLHHHALPSLSLLVGLRC